MIVEGKYVDRFKRFQMSHLFNSDISAWRIETAKLYVLPDSIFQAELSRTVYCESDTIDFCAIAPFQGDRRPTPVKRPDHPVGERSGT